MTRRRTSSARPPRRHWASAECSESTGTIWPGLAAEVTTSPPMISDSLLASARVDPAASAASVGRSPTAPVIALSTMSHGQRGHLLRRSRAGDDPGQLEVAMVVAAALGLRVERELDVLDGGAAGDADDGYAELDDLGGEQLGFDCRRPRGRPPGTGRGWPG